MARTPKTSIFEGISAIDAAGGIDGFVREVLAESNTLSLSIINQRTVPLGDEGCKELLGNVITEVVLRRLKPDIDRGFSKRLGEAIAACESPDDMDAASHRAFEDAKQWSGDLFLAVQTAIFGVVLSNEVEAEEHV